MSPRTSDHPDTDPGGRPPSLVRLLALSTRALTDILHERLRRAGFDDQRPADDAAFAHIPPEGIRLTDLAQRAGVTKQAMAEVVVSLEARGYLERSQDPTDGRAKLIRFSDRGWSAVTTALEVFDDIERELAHRIGARRIADLRRTLAEIHQDRGPDGVA